LSKVLPVRARAYRVLSREREQSTARGLGACERDQGVYAIGATMRCPTQLRPGRELAHRRHGSPKPADTTVPRSEIQPVCDGLQLANDERSRSDDHSRQKVGRNGLHASLDLDDPLGVE